MTEVRLYLDNREIEMLKDFIDPDTQTGIDNVALEWRDEVHSVLKALGDIVTAPGFERRVWREHVGRDTDEI